MIAVTFLSLSGPLKHLHTTVFADEKVALAAVVAHATSGGYTGVKTVDDETDGLRWTARTPGGRPGRNVASGMWTYAEAES